MPHLADTVRNLLPHGLKVAAAQALTGPMADRLVRAVTGDTVTHHGCRIQTKGSDVGTAALLAFGMYERAEIAMIHRHLPRGGDVIELGGSMGVTTCQIAKIASRVLSVEADPALALRLADNLKANNLSNVDVVSQAIDYSGSATVRFDQASSLGGHVSDRGVEVEATTLTRIVERSGFESYALVMDIEGAEIPLFLNESLDGCHMVQIEMDGGSYGGRTYGPDDVAELILNRGFRQLDRHGPVAVFVR
jgi:FkbM family methyltransferase